MPLVFLFFASGIFAHDAQVENIPSEKYFEVALNEIQNAKSSIRVYMYLISLDKTLKETRPYKLLEALIQAKERGVRVEAVLDQNVDFKEGTARFDDNARAKNVEAFEILQKNGVPVFYDDPGTYAHSKVVVIDEETVILGSTNWTQSGLSRNVESNLLVRSKEFAREIVEDLKKIKRLEPVFEPVRTVPLSWVFTNRKDLLGKMVTSADQRAFDIYLYLLKEYDGNLEGRVILKYDDFAKSIGIDNMTNEAYRRQIIKVLRKLEEKYKLIEFEHRHGKDAEIVLKDYEDPRKPYSAPRTRFEQIPQNFWDWGWARLLPFSGKVMYLLNLSYSAISQRPPRWQGSVGALSARHHISGDFISEGTTALRRANLVEVEFSQVGTEGYEQRRANTYFLNPLYNPRERDEKLKALETQYGKEKVERAKTLASMVYEDSDLSGIKALIELENQYGIDIIREAAGIIRQKNPDNSKRSMGYLINTIKGIGEKGRHSG